ncbi:16S rRNA (guanine(966)-N(2))-methyltransferase RsmD [Fuchsiella alkaliacetigena]|uniref:16S rRNA (guanine(966)-N(2))-methyltransferase RsmD n=1 Tax=Fuchsiella alkaliacetigena TaxID=957042 RepID=UPI00200A4CAF|nr:16S rRNA (guanine(966)-N(2))-methyltransferase RsmD [Fuchsiella alkaliacetigena]MCK8823600.1 16S rRNA (guanine(966)-N(2))-methyltransferase RsmD [Fuchsiella alkaliacetigena]
MRVIAGKAKGQKLKSSSTQQVRPTSDRVKESLFNILGTAVRETKVLDLYAGFGGLGIEALSRGAKEATFIEKSRQQVEIIQENLSRTGFSEQAQVIKGEVLAKLHFLTTHSFDIILLDPPYEADLVEPTIAKIMDLDLLQKAGVIVVEQSVQQEAQENLAALELIRNREYGNTRLSLYLKREEGE